MDGRESQILFNDQAVTAHGSAPVGEPGLAEWHDACKIPGMATRHRVHRVEAPAEDESYAEQARRRAARWHAWLTSPHCTLQDRENFERWCADPTNATAYVSFCGDLAAVPELAIESEGVGDLEYGARAFPLPLSSPRLEADTR
jgi:hypothetical protein